MTGAGYPHRSEVSGGRRWLSLFLLAVFTPMLWPAETWASLTHPAPPAPAYPFAVAAPDAAATVPTTTVVLRVTLTTTAAGDLAAMVAEEPLCTRAAAAVLTAAGTGRTPIRACARESKNAYRVFSTFQNAQILEVSQSIAAQCFVIGDDILGQSSGGSTAWLLYDGHGSTRALAGADAQGQPLITARYSYDAYGVMLGGDPSLSRPAATDLLYSGEQFDPGLQQQYLRARYYDQKAGVFASLDPFAGDNGDPQSLHKYAYCQGDGVNGLDPSGQFTLPELLLTVFLIVLWSATAGVNLAKHLNTARAVESLGSHPEYFWHYAPSRYGQNQVLFYYPTWRSSAPSLTRGVSKPWTNLQTLKSAIEETDVQGKDLMILNHGHAEVASLEGLATGTLELQGGWMDFGETDSALDSTSINSPGFVSLFGTIRNKHPRTLTLISCRFAAGSMGRQMLKDISTAVDVPTFGYTQKFQPLSVPAGFLGLMMGDANRGTWWMATPPLPNGPAPEVRPVATFEDLRP